MLDRGAAAGVLLYAAGDRGGEAPGDQRVLGEVFKVAAAADVAVDVQRGSKPEMHAEALHLIADDVSAALGKSQVPALRDCGADGDGGAVLLEDLALHPAVPFQQLHHKGGRRGHQLHHALRHAAV